MKKLFLTLILSLAFFGSTFAQIESDLYETNWPELNANLYENFTTVVAYFQIDDLYVEADGNWEALEVAAFVDGEIRGHSFMWDDDIYPYTELAINHQDTENGKAVTFQLYDHLNNILYTDCTPNTDVATGSDNLNIYWGEEPYLVLNFATPASITVTREIEGYGEGNLQGKYYLISTPIDGIDPEDIDGMTAENFDLYTFTDAVANEEWQNYKNDPKPFNTLDAGKGYLYAHETDITLTFTGAASTTTSVTLSKTEGADFSGWNLVGNPFNGPAYIAKEFYRMNGDGTDLVAPEADENFLNIMEGVFVLADNDGETLEFSTTAAKGTQVNLNLTKDNTLVDRAVVSFGQQRALPKFQLNPSHTKIYIPKDNEDFAVVSAENQGEMPVNFKAEANGTYTIGFNTDNVEFGYLHLIDNITGNDVDLLATPSYSFDATTSDYASRFRLVFATACSDNFAFLSNGEIVLNGVDGNASVQLFDVTGRMVCQSNGNARIATSNMAAGVYMVQLVNGENVKTQKIVVK